MAYGRRVILIVDEAQSCPDGCWSIGVWDPNGVKCQQPECAVRWLRLVDSRQLR